MRKSWDIQKSTFGDRQSLLVPQKFMSDQLSASLSQKSSIDQGKMKDILDMKKELEATLIKNEMLKLSVSTLQ